MNLHVYKYPDHNKDGMQIGAKDVEGYLGIKSETIFLLLYVSFIIPGGGYIVAFTKVHTIYQIYHT
jgi:hypothetical protein